MKLKQRIINEYCNLIQGSCDTADECILFSALYNLGLISYDKWADIPEKLENLYSKLEEDILSSLSDIYFQCNSCSWWFEWGEQSDKEHICGTVCENCEDDV